MATVPGWDQSRGSANTADRQRRPHALSSQEDKPPASIFPPAAVGHAGESARDLPGERGPAGGSRMAARTAPALQAKLEAHSEVLVGIAQQRATPNATSEHRDGRHSAPARVASRRRRA